jgi:hypothetical protein
MTDKQPIIILSVMPPGARDLLDKACGEYKKMSGKDIDDISGYSALYWFLRYSETFREYKQDFNNVNDVNDMNGGE